MGAAVAAGWIEFNESRRGRASWSHHCIRSSIPLPAIPTPDTPWFHIARAINDIPPADHSEGRSSQLSKDSEVESLLVFGRKAGDKVRCLSGFLNTQSKTAKC
jgi:hypothetical protein